MTIISADHVKQQAKELGADLCGISSIERFQDAPSGFHPTNIVASCKSVIVIAVRFPVSTLSVSPLAPYTLTHNILFRKIDSISFEVAANMERLGSCAVPIPASEPYHYWDDSRRHGQGILSLKHAAVRAGLGHIGKNTLLVNNQLGNLLCLGAILADSQLEADPIADYQVCRPGCSLCLDACPVKALNGTAIEQRKCRSICGKYTEGGGFVYTCNSCRKICPNQQELK